MKVMIVGTGVIGTIYAWALHKAGVDVTHFVRPGKAAQFKDGVTIDVLDERKGYEKYHKTTYPLKTTETINGDDIFELVLVPTNWYQTEAALKTIAPLCR